MLGEILGVAVATGIAYDVLGERIVRGISPFGLFPFMVKLK
jgi:hypothetical protein